MYNNTFEFIENVKALAERYDLDVSITGVQGVPIRVWIDKARVEVITTAKHCTITDGQGKRESFQKSISRWDKQSLEWIEELLSGWAGDRRRVQ